jgi:hypothetical protein
MHAKIEKASSDALTSLVSRSKKIWAEFKKKLAPKTSRKIKRKDREIESKSQKRNQVLRNYRNV